MKIEGFLKGGSWSEEVVAQEQQGVKLTRVSERWTLTGGFEGGGEAHYLLAYAPDGVVTYTGYERLEGRTEQRSGVIVVEVRGRFEAGVARGRWRVMPELCSGDFKGCEPGEGGYDAAGHDPAPFWLEL